MIGELQRPLHFRFRDLYIGKTSENKIVLPAPVGVKKRYREKLMLLNYVQRERLIFYNSRLKS